MTLLDWLWIFLGIVWIGACVCLGVIIHQWQQERLMWNAFHEQKRKVQKGLHEPF